MLDKALTHSYDHLFPYIRIEGKTPVPPPDPRAIDVAILDMNHSWPNVGHNSLVHAVREASSGMLALLDARGLVIRVLSFDWHSGSEAHRAAGVPVADRSPGRAA